MMPQINLLSLVLSPVLFYAVASLVFMLLSYLKLIKTDM